MTIKQLIEKIKTDYIVDRTLISEILNLLHGWRLSGYSDDENEYLLRELKRVCDEYEVDI